MRTKISPELIEKYLMNRCNAEEVKLLYDWYASFEDIPEPVESLSPAQQKEIKEKMLKSIRSNLGYNLPSSVKKSGNKVHRLFYSAALIAATVIIVFSIVHYFLPEIDSLRPETTNAKGILTFSNNSNKLKNYILPDGSSAWLKPHTNISYLQNSEKYREVRLEGECFFDVKHDASHPFIIYTGELRTRVLGTSFNVKALSHSGLAEISVVTGKVYVYIPKKGSSEQKGVILQSAQKAMYNQKSKTMIQVKETSKDLRIWEKTSISFENEPIGKVAEALNARFNVKINVEDPVIRNYTLKADFTGQNLPAILEMISRSLDVNYEITEKKILIKSN